jgi:hypothetical protein
MDPNCCPAKIIPHARHEDAMQKLRELLKTIAFLRVAVQKKRRQVGDEISPNDDMKALRKARMYLKLCLR